MHVLNEAMCSLAPKKKVKTRMKDNLEEESGFSCTGRRLSKETKVKDNMYVLGRGGRVVVE